jgi:FKBP-type peptidyl-prolyl cis-trans isomerase SlyD
MIVRTVHAGAGKPLQAPTHRRGNGALARPRRQRGARWAKISVFYASGTHPDIRNHTMKIAKDTAVTLSYKVADAQGKLVEQSSAPMVYLHGGYGNTLPKIEEALDGQEKGFQTVLALEPQDAFGLRDESLVRTIPRTQFPPGVKVGGQLEGRGEDGRQHVFNVMKIKGDTVLLDGNHPLAGKALRFTLKVTDVRAASEEEIAHRHVHGEHGHHH